jgi:hypothetical protein
MRTQGFSFLLVSCARDLYTGHIVMCMPCIYEFLVFKTLDFMNLRLQHAYQGI